MGLVRVYDSDVSDDPTPDDAEPNYGLDDEAIPATMKLSTLEL